MNELDEKIAEVYRGTNTEIMELFIKSQERIHRNNILLSAICIILSVSVTLISAFCYYNNLKWLEVFNSYEYEIVEYSQTGEGINSISGTMGDFINGAASDN